MDLKPIIVRDYLETLTEDKELDVIFRVLLESQGFIIKSKPEEYKGMSQYGKDIVAVGKDFGDGLEKRFYFELKGGSDRHITSTTFTKEDGIRESLIEAKDAIFKITNKNQDNLPLKIVLVHNGELKANVKDTFDGFIKREFPEDGNVEFDRWGISELVNLFSEHLFGAFLMADDESTKLFNKTLVNLDVSNGVSSSFIELLDKMFDGIKDLEYNKTLPRKYTVLFESLNLISFIIYTESKNQYNNLDIAKRYTTHLILRFWYWILKNRLETDKKVIDYFRKSIQFYFNVLQEYFERTIPFARLKDGLSSSKGGRYEQIGYTYRTFEYLKYFNIYLSMVNVNEDNIIDIINELTTIINNNTVSVRPLIDIHSIPIVDILNFYIETKQEESAKNYLKLVLDRIRLRKIKYNILPDANNSIENVIKLTMTGEKSIYYSDSTSLLLGTLIEYLVILDMKDDFYVLRDFAIDNEIDLALFIPFNANISEHLERIEDKENDLEEQLFSKIFFNEGYQSTLVLNKELSFEAFKDSVLKKKHEFEYEYRTEKAGFGFLLNLAHVYFQTPYFPDRWRPFLV